MTDREEARILLAMAEKDLRALSGMADPLIFAEEVFGFHAQQATEKALKAWIIASGREAPLTHDLSRLLAVLEEGGCDIERYWALLRYNPFAVQFRYSAINVKLNEDRAAAVAEIGNLWNHVRDIVEV